MNELLPGLYDHIEPVAHRIALRAAGLEPVDAQGAYLVGVARQIVESGRYRVLAPASPPPPTDRVCAGCNMRRALTQFVAGSDLCVDCR